MWFVYSYLRKFKFFLCFSMYSSRHCFDDNLYVQGQQKVSALQTRVLESLKSRRKEKLPHATGVAQPRTSLEYPGLKPGSSQTRVRFGIARKGW